MEEINVEDDLRLCELKKENLRKAMEKVKSQVSELLVFNLQWSDLEEYIKLAEGNVEKRLREVESKEVELEKRSVALDQRATVVEAAEAEMGDLKMKADGFRNEIQEKRKDLDYLNDRVYCYRNEYKTVEMNLVQLKTAVKECAVEHRSMTGQLNKTQLELELKREQLAQLETDFEKHLGCSQTRSRELEEQVERKTNVLTLVLDKTAECEKLFQTLSLELKKTQDELELKREQLGQMKSDLERHHNELSAEKEHLFMNQARDSQLEVEIERKNKDLTALQNKIADYGKHLESGEKKSLETRSSEEKKLEGLLQAKRSAILDLDLVEEMVKSLKNDMKETCQQMESKAKELEDIENMIEERNEHYDSIKLLIEEHNEELASKEKRQDEITEAIRNLSLEIASKEKTLARADVTIRQLSEKQRAKEKKLDSTKETTAEKKKKLGSVKHRLKIKEKELKSLQSLIEEGEKKMQDLDNSNEELVIQLQVKKEEIRKCSSELESKRKELDQVQRSITDLTAELTSKECDLNSLKKKIQDSLRDFQSKEKEKLIIQLQVKRDEVFSISNAIRECSSVLESKRKERDQVQRSITYLTAELTSKECDLNSVKKKIQDSLEDFQSKEEQQIELKASLTEREQELGRKEKQFDVRSEEIELKEKKLDARQEKLDKKDQQLKSTEERLAKWVKDYELKAKQLSSFCQQSKPDQHVDLVRDANLKDEKTLRLLLCGHLKKCHQLHDDILSALKASSDPPKLVLDTIHGRMAITNLDPDSVRRSSICLLECLMDISPKPNSEVQGEANKFAADWKNAALVNAESPVEGLRFLHFLAVFSLAYTFDTDKVQNLFDAAFLRKYAPSLCEALGVSALTPVKDVISPTNNNRNSSSSDIQENAGVSQSANGNALMDPEGPASLSREEVSSGLRSFKDPRRVVLDYVEEALVGAHQRGELGLAEPIIKALIPLLEELTQDTNPIDPLLQPTATRLANLWSSMMGTSAQMSPFEAWGYLQLIVAYGLVDGNSQVKFLQFALSVAHFNQAPKLFQSLGLNYAIPNIVSRLLNDGQYISAIRYMIFFNLRTKFSPVEFLKEEIINLRRSAKEKRRIESQAQDRDAGKLRDIIQVIEDFKLEIDLPVDLIVKFMVPRVGIQNQNQCVVSSSVPAEQVYMQASQTIIHSSYMATHGSNVSLPNPEVVDVETYEASGSSAFQAWSPHLAGFKRPRVDPPGPSGIF